MNIVRRITKGLLIGALIAGFARPAFAAAPLTEVFDEPNPVTVIGVSTAIGDTTGGTTYVSAVETTNHALRVQAYYLDTADVLIDRDADLGGTIKGADIARIGGNGLVVVAAHLSTNEMKLIAYDVTSGSNGREITRFAPSIQPPFINVVSDITITGVGKLSNQQFVTAVRTSDGTMRLDSWDFDHQNNTFIKQDTKPINSSWGDFEMIGNYNHDWFTFATAHQNDQGNMVVTTWRLDPTTGTMTKGSTVARGVVNGFDLALASDRLYTASHTSGGGASVEYWEVNTIGQLTITDIKGTLTGVADLQVFDMHDGSIVVTIKDVNNFVRHQFMYKNATAIQPGVSVSMNKAISTFDGDYYEGRLFFAVKNGGNNDLSHELWKD